MSRHILHITLTAASLMLATPALAQTADGKEPPMPMPETGMNGMAGMSGMAGDPDTLKALTDQVVDSLNVLEGKKKEQAPQDYESLMNALGGLVEKAMKQGKSSEDVLALIDEALKARKGLSLEELMKRSGGKLDMRGLLQQLVSRAAQNATRSTGQDDYIKALASEGSAAQVPAEGKAAGKRASAGGRIITIKPGDTLGSIARTYYGDGAKWKLIYQANRNVISNPDIIPVGRKLRLP